MSNSSTHPKPEEEKKPEEWVAAEPDDDFDDIELGERQPDAQELKIT